MPPIPTGLMPNLDGLGPYSAMLFDVYGTLLISGAGEIGDGRDWSSDDCALDRLLRRYGIGHTPGRIAKALNQAIEADHAISRQQGIDFPEVDIIRIWQRVLGSDQLPWIDEFALEYELIVNPVAAMPGLRELLAAGRAANTAMGIISNAQFYTPCVLEQALGASLGEWGFNRRLIFFSWLERHAKPSPVMFERARAALAEMGISASSVLYVGNDMRNDLLPAASVGFRTALFAGDRRSLRLREGDECCREVVPDLMITDLRQLIAGVGGVHAR